MWDAFEKQQESVTKTKTPSPVLKNPALITVPVTKHFRAADFTNSGRIDDDECVEVLQAVSQDLGFEVPSMDKVDALLANAERGHPGSMQLKEFVQFVKSVIAYDQDDAAPQPAEKVPPPVTPVTPFTPSAVAPTKAVPTPLAAPQLAPPTTPAAMPTIGAGVGNLRVRVLEVEGLPARADGSPCEPYATIAVTELTRRRTRRTRTSVRGPSATWTKEVFDFDRTSIGAQVVVDVWDGGAGRSPGVPLGKLLLPLADCRAGVPHTVIKPLLDGGRLVVRALFDDGELPSAAEEEAAFAA